MVYRSRFMVGFTMVELVIVLVIVGILSVFIAPRFFTKQRFDAAGFYEQSRAAIRYGQKIAIASGCDTRVRFTAGNPGSYSIQRWASCVPVNHTAATQAIQQPDGRAFTATSPQGVSVSGLDFYFDRIGRPRQISAANPPPLISNPGDLDVSIDSRTIQVQPQTGYVQ